MISPFRFAPEIANGSGVYYRLLAQPAVPDREYIMSAGTLSDQSMPVVDHEVYVRDRRPARRAHESTLSAGCCLQLVATAVLES